MARNESQQVEGLDQIPDVQRSRGRALAEQVGASVLVEQGQRMQGAPQTAEQTQANVAPDTVKISDEALHQVQGGHRHDETESVASLKDTLRGMMHERRGQNEAEHPAQPPIAPRQDAL